MIANTNAGFIRYVFVYGNIVVDSDAFYATLDINIYARETPARSYIFETR